MERPGLRITTWNVNGIRNPFAYQPWNQERSFGAMFDILEADIVVMQETKIQRKDLRDDMVLVPGWDVFFSLPKHKKGYSGVAIYTRNSLCAPFRAEEGITGILTAPNSNVSFRDLPENQRIGGYPTQSQLSDFPLDASTLDSEGRCLILEFPAIVLIGVYCPANRDESRDDFRLGFLNALDARVRNLIVLGKRVFVAGDLNIIREEIDTANAEEQLKRHGMTGQEYVSTPARRMLNQLLVGGKVFGERDEEKESSVMWDICRAFHPTRKGMFTCWEQKTNARPGNFGSRIDYVMCSLDCYDWFEGSNIQEGLMGSDHCPVYATFKSEVEVDGVKVDIRDVFSDGMFKNGVRLREWTNKDLLPLSAKLIPEFDRRRSIRDMLSKGPVSKNGERSASSESSSTTTTGRRGLSLEPLGKTIISQRFAGEESSNTISPNNPSRTTGIPKQSATKPSFKRGVELDNIASRPGKRTALIATSDSTTAKRQLLKGQRSLVGFFKPKIVPNTQANHEERGQQTASIVEGSTATIDGSMLGGPEKVCQSGSDAGGTLIPSRETNPNSEDVDISEQKDVIDSVAAKETWSKLLGGRKVPNCEHGEPCKSLITKKPGINCGRSFYMCPRPLGPSGQKERNTEWRCSTFIWSSDWTGDGE